VAGALAQSSRLRKHIMTDFVADLESNFIYYCENHDHSDFSLMQAWKCMSVLHNYEKTYRLHQKDNILRALNQRWSLDQNHLSDS